MKKIFSLFTFCLLITGCSNQIAALAVEPGEVAIACGKVKTGAVIGLFSADVDGFTCELPDTVDTSTWTAEDWRKLAEIID